MPGSGNRRKSRNADTSTRYHPRLTGNTAKALQRIKFHGKCGASNQKKKNGQRQYGQSDIHVCTVQYAPVGLSRESAKAKLLFWKLPKNTNALLVFSKVSFILKSTLLKVLDFFIFLHLLFDHVIFGIILQCLTAKVVNQDWMTGSDWILHKSSFYKMFIPTIQK